MISFELVPRTLESINKQLSIVEKFDFIDTINIPDIARLDIRSYDIKVKSNYNFFPHIRATDFNLNENRLFDIIEENELKKVLIISGDNGAPSKFNTTTLKTIEAIKDRYPDIIVSAGFDQYRGSLKKEKEYCLDKLHAGADYLMSQPFFDKELLNIYLDFIPASQMFIGISPVITEKSKAYWENINSVVFPKSFNLGCDWNIDFAKEILALSKKIHSNIYFMPIAIDLEEYLAKFSSSKRIVYI